MSAPFTVQPLTRRSADVLRFLRVSYDLYREDPLWVAPLLDDLKKVFTDANPLFDHAEMQLWVAVRDGRDIGRIAAILDRAHVETHHDPAAFFGFFECVNEPAVSRALFAAADDWARARGLKRLLGPMNPTTNDECGLLVKGHDSPPYFMMPHNPRYYENLVLADGFGKAKDLIAFRIDLSKCPLERLGRIADKVKRRHPELRFRPVRRKTLMADLGKVKEVYNAAWEANWGFVAMTDGEIDFLARRLKPLFMEGLVWLAEAGTEPVGFLLALPDYNVALKPLRGRLLTPRLLGFLPYLLRWKYPPRCRVLTLGVKGRYRGKGLESVMLTEGFKVGLGVGFTEAEASWILEDNVMMCRVIETMGGEPYKIYRLYDRAV